MSENQAGQQSYTSRYPLDPRLDEWPQNWSPLIQPGRQRARDQGQSQILPPISPYSTETSPREASLNNDYPSGMRAYSPYEEQQYERVFPNTEQPYSHGPSPINDSDLQLDSSTAEYMSLSDQRRLHQFSECGPDQLLLQPNGTPLGGRPIPNCCFCPTCGAVCANREEFRSHFVACVAQNGNPSGVYLRDVLGSARPQSERTRKTIDRLNAVNGVVIPSKLAVGESPYMAPCQPGDSTTLNFSCPLCKGPFGRVDHVRSHFPACVNRNGNPDGLRWDDGLPVLTRSPKAPKS